jgi:regulator of protease activity HflC (stomatin/prohibitin superfamily)
MCYLIQKLPQIGNFSTTIFGVLLALVVFFAINSFVIINPGQAGVISTLGQAKDGALLEGIHLKTLFITVIHVYDLTVQKFDVPAESSTENLQNLTARFAIDFRIDPMKVVDIRRKQATLAKIVSKIIAPPDPGGI